MRYLYPIQYCSPSVRVMKLGDLQSSEEGAQTMENQVRETLFTEGNVVISLNDYVVCGLPMASETIAMARK